MEQCDLDTEESSVLEHKEYAESIGASRNTVKIRKKSTRNELSRTFYQKNKQQYYLLHYACCVCHLAV